MVGVNCTYIPIILVTLTVMDVLSLNSMINHFFRKRFLAETGSLIIIEINK